MEMKTLQAIYNTLLEIETKGESTILMGACIQLVRDELKKMAVEQSQQSIEA